MNVIPLYKTMFVKETHNLFSFQSIDDECFNNKLYY